jgi:hypothetical protein
MYDTFENQNEGLEIDSVIKSIIDYKEYDKNGYNVLMLSFIPYIYKD